MVIKTKFETHQFSIILAVIQVIFLIIFCFFSEHRPSVMPGGIPEIASQVNYTDFQDIHITLIVGFGFLVAFLRRYGIAAFGISLLLVAFSIEWALIVRGFLSPEYMSIGKFNFSIMQLINADFTAAVILISFGAIIGKLSPVQYLILVVIEVPISILAEHTILNKLKVQDAGGSIVVHLFGAIFGIAVSRILVNKAASKSNDLGSVYHSEVFTFIGSAFLWVFWPSFNAVKTVGDERYRAIINSYFGLVASTVTAFLFSHITDPLHHFNIRHIASASLAGGVALGACANIIIVPVHAFIIGSLAGIVSICCFRYITPIIDNKFGIHDTRGVLALHGLPGILGAIGSTAYFIIYPDETYAKGSIIIAPGRNNTDQAWIQLAGAGIAFIIALVGGAITGLILKVKFLNQVAVTELYSDGPYFKVPEDYEFTTRVTSNIDRVELNEAPVVPQVAPGLTTSHTHITNPESAELTQPLTYAGGTTENVTETTVQETSS